MQKTFQGFTAVWQRPEGEWPIWIAARSQAQASVCAQVLFAVLETQLARARGLG